MDEISFQIRIDELEEELKEMYKDLKQNIDHLTGYAFPTDGGEYACDLANESLKKWSKYDY